MYKYAVDSFDQITLDFQVMIKRKLWGGTIEIAPDEIEYVWEQSTINPFFPICDTKTPYDLCRS